MFTVKNYCENEEHADTNVCDEECLWLLYAMNPTGFDEYGYDPTGCRNPREPEVETNYALRNGRIVKESTFVHPSPLSDWSDAYLTCTDWTVD